MLMVGCRSDRNLNPSSHTFAQGSYGSSIVMLWLGLCLNYYLVFVDDCKVCNHKSTLILVYMEFFMNKLFSILLKDKASDWNKLLDNSDLLEWPDLMSLFYAKFYPLREIHQDRNYIYNF